MKELIKAYREDKSKMTIEEQIKVVEYQLSILDNVNGTETVINAYKRYQVELVELYKKLIDGYDFKTEEYQNIRVELYNNMENSYYKYYGLIRGVNGKAVALEFENLRRKVRNSRLEIHKPCERCGGSGILNHFKHNDNGICFKCKGTGRRL